jgi:peptidoglycan/LPS O-acetylase OafA/YrhL
MPSHSGSATNNYRPEIQGLRALAVAAVIVNHFNSGLLPSGDLGVDIFFVISGFVITSSLAGSRHLPFKEYILDFYYRRIKRLFPTLVLCVVATCLIGLLFIPPKSDFFDVTWRTGISALFGVSNFYLLLKSFDYFSTSSEFNLFTQTWSLGVEEQFYFLFPALVWIAGRWSATSIRWATNLFVFVAALLGCSIFLFIHLSQSQQAIAFYLMPSRFWELGAGCLAFLVIDRKAFAINLPKLLRPEYFLLAMLATLVVPQSYQVATTILVVILSGFLIMSVHQNSSAYRILTLKPLMYIGLISYPLYLWHWSVLVISRWTTGIHWWSIPIQLGLMLVMAAATHHYVEAPLKNYVWATNRARAIAYGVAISAVSAVLLVGVGVPFKGWIYSGSDPDFNQINSLRSKGNGAFLGPSSTSEFSEAAKSLWLINKRCNMTPQMLTGKYYQPKPDVNQTFIQNCISGQNPKIVLVGDSFSSMIAAHTALAASKIGYEFKTIFGYGCPFPLHFENIAFKSQTSCPIDIQLLRTELQRNLNRGDIVVLRLYFPSRAYINFSRDQVLTKNAELFSAYDLEIEALYREVFARGGSLLLIGSNPTIEFSPACNSPQWFNYFLSTECSKGVPMDSSGKTLFSLGHDQHLASKFSNTFPKFEFVDITRLLCDEAQGNCKTSIDGAYLYQDNQHITSAAVDLIYENILSSLQRLSDVKSKS